MKNPIFEGNKKKDRLSWALSFALLQDIFIYEVTMLLQRQEVKNIRTMGVSVINNQFLLKYNSDFVNKLTDNELFAVLKHECLHLVLQHCTTRRMAPHKKHNISADLAINCLINDLPKESLYPAKYGLKDLKSCEWYFNNLPETKVNLQSANGETLDSHEGWEENEIMGELIRQKVNEMDKRGAWGSLSEGEIELIRAANIKKYNWKNVAKRFVGNLISKYKTSTRKKPNRRYGFMFPGYKKGFTAKILAAIDTSGSVTNDMLGEFLSTINHISEEFELDLMEFDCEIQNVKRYNKKQKTFKFKGRGGTDFEPVITYSEKHKYSGLIILTDGIAPAPHQPRHKVLWVCPPGYSPPVKWGKVIVLS